MQPRVPTPNEKRMEQFCAIRRPLTDAEIAEVKRLRIAIYNADYRRRRYSSDLAFRAAVIARSTRDTTRRRRAQRGLC